MLTTLRAKIQSIEVPCPSSPLASRLLSLLATQTQTCATATGSDWAPNSFTLKSCIIQPILCNSLQDTWDITDDTKFNFCIFTFCNAWLMWHENINFHVIAIPICAQFRWHPFWNDLLSNCKLDFRPAQHVTKKVKYEEIYLTTIRGV